MFLLTTLLRSVNKVVTVTLRTFVLFRTFIISANTKAKVRKTKERIFNLSYMGFHSDLENSPFYWNRPANTQDDLTRLFLIEFWNAKAFAEADFSVRNMIDKLK